MTELVFNNGKKFSKREAKLRELVESYGKLIDAHRKIAFITCAEDCWCWDADSFRIELEAVLKEVE